MVGDALLVAPLVEGEWERDVLLPSGIWYGLETGERYTGGRVIRIHASLEQIPVFVKSGSVIPMMPDLPHVPQAGTRVALELVHFGSEPGEGLLYDDDGETFNYEKGECGWWKATVTQNADGEFNGKLTGPDGEIPSYDSINWRFAQTRLEASCK